MTTNDVPLTSAEIAGLMNWRGPGAYTVAAERKIMKIIAEAVRREREACAQLCRERGERNRIAEGKPKGDRDEFYCADDIIARGTI